MSLHLCADSPEPSLLVNAISGNLVHLPMTKYWLVYVVKYVTKLSLSWYGTTEGPNSLLSIIAMIFDFLGHYCIWVMLQGLRI